MAKLIVEPVTVACPPPELQPSLKVSPLPVIWKWAGTVTSSAPSICEVGCANFRLTTLTSISAACGGISSRTCGPSSS